MMRLRRLTILGALLATGLALTACGTTGGLPASGTGVVTTTTPTSLDSTTVSDIQNAAARACSFVPTIQTIQSIAANFFTAGGLVNGVVSGVENAICSAVAPKASARRRVAAGPPTAYGVPIQGYFLK